MKKLVILLICVSGVSLSIGCAPVLIGAGAVGGYAVSRDAVIDHFDIAPEQVFAEALKAAHAMGMVTVQDAEHGLIKADLGNTRLTIHVEPITKKTTKLKVSARNQFFLPKIETAQMVYARIAKNL